MLDSLDDTLLQIAERSEDIKQYFDEGHRWAQAAVLGAFATINSIRVLAYIPQLVKAARDSNGASAISYTTWGLFAASRRLSLSSANTQSTPVSLGKPDLFIKANASNTSLRSCRKARRRLSQVIARAIGAGLLAFHET